MTRSAADSKSITHRSRQWWSSLIAKCVGNGVALIKCLDGRVELNGVLAWQNLSQDAEGLDSANAKEQLNDRCPRSAHHEDRRSTSGHRTVGARLPP